MQDRLNRGLWATVWIGSVLLGVVLCLLYTPLPVDGATGDMTSFTRNGFVTHWLLEVRSGGLQVGDTIIRAGGYTLDEWLSGAPRGPEWESGGVVDYEVLRDGTPITLPIGLSRVPFAAILGRWWAQLLISLGLILIGLFLFLKQSDELPARLLMLFCTMTAVQIWGDAYNFQYALFPHRNLFWFQFLIENGSFILIYASILHFSLVFPKKHQILKRWLSWTLVAVYILPLVVVSLVMALSTSWTQAMMVGGRVSWIVALIQAVLAIIIGIRSYLTASDPVSRAQLRWIVWGAGLVLTIMLPTYIVPMVLIGRSIIPHPFVMLLTALLVVIVSVSILRYRLFDIEIVINRTLVYGSLTLLLVGIYILLVRILTLVAQRIFDSYNESWVVFVSTIIIALAFNPLRLRIQNIIDRTFYREKLNYRQLLPELTARIPSGILTTVLPELMSQELPYMLRISHATLYLLDSYGTKFDPITNEPWPILPMNHPLVLTLKQKGRPIQRRKLGEVKDEQLLQWLEEHQIELALPLLAGDEMVGIYNLGAKLSGSVYSPEEVRLLDQFSSQVALAIKSSRLLQAEQEQRLRAEKLAEQMTALLKETNHRADQLEAVNAIIAVAVAAPEITHLLKGMLDLILEALGGEIGGLLVSGHVYNRGIPEAFLRYSLQISQGMGWVGSSTIVVKDWTNVEDASLAGWAANMTNAEIHSSLIVPVMVGGRHSGVLTLASQAPGEWDPEDVAVIKAVVRQLGSALERFDLLSQTKEQARQVQQILDTVPDGVLLLDESYHIIDANPAANEYLAYLITDPSSNQPITFLGGRSMDEFIEYTPEQPWHEVICEGPPRRVFEIAIRSIYEEHPSRGWVVVIRDVSVERENQARTQMQDRLATVGQLAAGIAHDFNNIMAAIQVYVDLFAIDTNISQEGHQRLEIIQNQIFRASGLIRQILDFSRRSVMEETYMDLLPLIKEMEKLLKRLLPENIRVEFHHQPGEYMIKADPTRLQQVFLNLSLNARDAMPSGGVLRFELSHAVFDRGENIPNPEIKPGKWICIVVKDTGIGIPEENLPHVFDPFFTTKKMGQGTGLGLAQVYGIVSGHGGVIDLNSIEGKGTDFTIYLPELSYEAEEPEKAIVVEEISGAGEIVLVAEDDPATRDAIRVLLESLNYHVLTASNGEEALQVFQRAKQPIALLVCDMVMPEMDGLPLYQAIKELNGKQLPKVLFVSGYPVDLNELMMDEDDNVDWLQKPFSVQEFAAAVRRALG